MSINPAKAPAWKDLETLYEKTKSTHLNSFFEEDPKRFEKFSAHIEGLFFDYSKQRISDDILNSLIQLSKECHIENKRDAMFSGKKINSTEDRAALHTALRRPKEETLIIDGHDIMEEVSQTRDKMRYFSENLRNGNYTGATGKTIKHIISIGIGGSDFGPRLVCKALKKGEKKLKLDFVSNIDAHDIKRALNKAEAEETLFIIISKSFKTQDTVINANTAKDWLISHLSEDADISRHLVAVSSNKENAFEFGVKEENFFPVWNWVNGRFSLWSAVGLPICIKFGYEVFENLLKGAYDIDTHFQKAPIEKNIPILMALIGIWNRNFIGSGTLAILPYSQDLFFLPAYLRQLDMESNGKTTDLDGNIITDYQTGPVIFGEAGTNGQHSFYQLLHQGSDIIASDFIGVVTPRHNLKNHHSLLLSHMLSQSQALMQGKQSSKNPHKFFKGNKPSTTILIDQLDAYHLGMLIALYEHKVFVQGLIWNINSFDQFGVELGKELSQKLEENDLSSADPSTRGLYSLIHKAEK